MEHKRLKTIDYCHSPEYIQLRDNTNNTIDQVLSQGRHLPFLVTFTFNFLPWSDKRASTFRYMTDAAWNFYYYDVYGFILSNLDNHSNRKPALRPHTFDFFDVPGTKDTPFFAPFNQDTIPHIHSIYLVHEQTLPRFQKMVDTNFSKLSEHKNFIFFDERNVPKPIFASIDAKKIKSDLPGVVSYASKFYDNYGARRIWNYPLFNRSKPLSLDEKEDLKEIRELQPFYRKTTMLRKLKHHFRKSTS